MDRTVRTSAKVQAESFQLRNGIQFGDSIDTVISKEKLELEKEEEYVNSGFGMQI